MTKRDKTFERRELIQLRVGVYQLIFAFEGDITLSVESAVKFELGTEKGEWFPEQPAAAAILTQLVGKAVSQVEDVDDNDLRLVFADGGILVVSGKSVVGEAYQITVPSGVYVV